MSIVESIVEIFRLCLLAILGIVVFIVVILLLSTILLFVVG